MTSVSHLRRQVLQTYRRILRVARTWEAEAREHTPAERAYIRVEARTLFKKNKEACNNIIMYDELINFDIMLGTLFFSD